MINNVKRIMMLFLCAVMVFGTACGKGPDSLTAKSPNNPAMGRYIEKTLKFPSEDAIGNKGLIKRSDGSLDYYATFDGKPCTLYNTKDGVNWDKNDIPWFIEAVNMGYGVVSIAYDADDNVYLLLRGSDEDYRNKVFKVTEDDKLKEINIDWKKSEIEGVGIYAIKIEIAQNGDLIIYQLGTGILQYSNDGVFKNQYGGSRAEEFALSGDNIFIVDMDASEIIIYDTNTRELLKSIPYDNMTQETYLSPGKGGSIYLTDRSGVYRLADGGSLWEKIIDGELTSLSIPSQYFSEITEGPDDNFYMIFGDSESNSTFVKYEYDEKISSLPGTELVVYTLYENKTLRQAAGELQRKNSDIKVNIRVGINNESSITKADAVRALNTELLVGKGPDVILLDGMPIDLYISKGVLTDLSDVVAKLKANGEDLFDNVINSYEKDSKIFAVPAKFVLPSMWIDEEYSKDVKNLKQLAEFTLKHNDKIIFPYSSPQELIRLFSVSSFPYWTDDEGAIKEAEFEKFLSDIKSINDANKKFITDEMREEAEKRKNANTSSGQDFINSMDINSTDVLSWAFGRAYAYCDVLRSYNSVSLPSLAIKQRNGGVAVLLPGPLEKTIFVPINCAGVNANSTQIDTAKEFIEIMLSSSVQNAQTYDGFPVNIKSLEYGAEGKGNENTIFGVGSDDGGEKLFGPLPSSDELNKVKELCLTAAIPSIVDENLLDMIIDETEGYFTGEKTIEKAVEDVKEKTKLYLSE